MPHGHLGSFTERRADELFFESPAFPTATHARHLLRAPAQDPHVIFHGGFYYYCESSALGIFVRSARHFFELGAAEPRCVWTPPARGMASRNLWAPELHHIDGQFYIYFAADDGLNENHRMWVLQASNNDPTGTYELAGSLETGGWAIDGTVLTDVFGNHTFVWSGWPAGGDGKQQNLYMARMKSPLELGGSPVLLTQPDHSWEKRAMAICEGPQVIQRGSRTCIVYSASGSWTQDYCLGLLVHDGGDLLDPRCWKKIGPVFKKNEHACGVGHCCFVTTPDGMEDWIIYHAKTSRRRGWNDREVRAQAFTWNEDRTPSFGTPLPSDRDLMRVVATSPLAAQSA